MSLAKECPFVLSFDAIANLDEVLELLKQNEYRAAPNSGHTHFRPEFHLPVQLIAHTCTHTPANVADGHRKPVNDIRTLVGEHLAERYGDSDGDMTFGLTEPFIRVVLDSDHGIRRDPTRYGEELIPTQLVIDHALRLRDMLTKSRINNTTNEQMLANGKLNIAIVTHYPATIAIALAEGFQVWNYDLGEQSIRDYETLLMEQGLVQKDPTPDGDKTIFVPVRYEKPDSTAAPAEAGGVPLATNQIV